MSLVASDPTVRNPLLLPVVAKLLRLRILIWIGSFRRARLRGKLGYIFLGLLLLAGLVFAFFISWWLLRFLRSPQFSSFVSSPTEFLDRVPVLVVSATFVGILLTSFGVLLQALYLAGDMDFLLSAPIPIRAVFVTKLLQAILPNFSLTLLFGLPVLFGLGASAGYNPLYYPLVVVILSLLALAAAGISALLVMLIVRIFPARRVAEVLGFLVGTMSFLCSQSGQLANYTDLSSEQAGQALNFIARFDVAWSPLAWAGRGLVAIGESNWISGIGLVFLSSALAAGIFLLALATAERLYYSGWTQVQSVSSRRKKRRRTARAANQTATLIVYAERLIPAPVRGIAIKDWRVLRRDLRNLSNLVMPLIFGVIYTFMLLRSRGEPNLGRGEAPEWFNQAVTNISLYANVAISLFVAWSLSSRLALMSFSQEGRAYWIVRSAPVTTSKLLAAKFTVALVPALGLSWGFMLVTFLVRGGTVSVFLYSLLAVTLSIAGLVGINLTFGVLGANFTWDDPRRISGGASGCLGTVASMLYLVIALAFFFGPVLLIAGLGFQDFYGQLAGSLLGGGFALAGALIPLYLVRKKVPLLGEGV